MTVKNKNKTLILKRWWVAVAAFDFYLAGLYTSIGWKLVFIAMGVWMLWPIRTSTTPSIRQVWREGTEAKRHD
jgi:hypothetical protein